MYAECSRQSVDAGKWREGRPRWVERLQQERVAHELADSHAEAVDLCLEAARMARDAGVEGALRADQHWLPQGTMQVRRQQYTRYCTAPVNPCIPWHCTVISVACML